MTYQQSDVEVVYRRGAWNSWADIVGWFQRRMAKDEQADNELSEAESRQMLADFERLDERGTAFTHDPTAAYEALQSAQRR